MGSIIETISCLCYKTLKMLYVTSGSWGRIEINVFVNSINSFYLNSRYSVYLNGGVLFVTTRILVVDMLKNTVPIESVTGFIVLKAHK